MGTKDSKQDFNNMFDIPALLSMDRKELEKLNDLFPHYQRRYFPSFNMETWNRCLEIFFLKAHLYDDKKSGGKFFGWFSKIVFNEFLRSVTYDKKRKRKIEYIYYEDTFSSSSSISTSNQNLPEEANKAFMDEPFDFDAAIDFPDGEPNKLEELIKKYAEDDELIALELYIRGAKTTTQEKALVIKFKNRVKRHIYTKEKLDELKKSKECLSTLKKDIDNRARSKRDYDSTYKNLTPEERLERRLKKKAERRIERLSKFQETLSPKDYAEKLRQLEYYDKVQEEQNQKNIENSRIVRAKKKAEKIKLRNDILNNETI